MFMHTLQSFLHSRFYHYMDVYAYESLVEDFVTKQVLVKIFSRIPCFFSRASSPHFSSLPSHESLSYSGKIYFPSAFSIPANSFISLSILGDTREFIQSGEEVLYPSHKEIFVVKKEVAS